MNWQSLVLLHALFSAFQALQFRAIARAKSTRKASLAVNAIAFSSLYVCGLMAIPLLGGQVSINNFLTDFILYFSTAGLIVLALFFMYQAMTHLDSAIVSVLGTSSALFTVVLAMFFFSETLSALQVFGIMLLLPCLWYVLLLARGGKKMIDFKDRNWLKGFIFTIIYSFCLAFAHVLEKAILEKSNIATYIAYGWLLQVLIAWLLYYSFGRHSKFIFRSNKIMRSSMQLGVFRAATALFFVMALVKSDSVSLVTVVANFRIVLVAVLAGWLLNERSHYYKKIAAAGFSVVALSIILWN